MNNLHLGRLLAVMVSLPPPAPQPNSQHSIETQLGYSLATLSGHKCSLLHAQVSYPQGRSLVLRQPSLSAGALPFQSIQLWALSTPWSVPIDFHALDPSQSILSSALDSSHDLLKHPMRGIPDPHESHLMNLYPTGCPPMQVP